MLTKILLTITFIVSGALAAPAPASAPQLLQPATVPVLFQSQPQFFQAPQNLQFLERPVPLVYSSYQAYPIQTANLFLLRQGGITGGGEFADQVQDYFGMFGGQLTQLQNQTSGIFQDAQSNIESSFGQGFELVSQGFGQGFEQINQGWGEIQQQWGPGKTADNLMSSGAKDETRLEKNDNKIRSQTNLLLKPLSLRYFENKLVPFGFVRYNLVPLNSQQLQKKQEQQPQQQARMIEEKIEKEEPKKVESQSS